jgi:hypothetical protein
MNILEPQPPILVADAGQSVMTVKSPRIVTRMDVMVNFVIPGRDLINPINAKAKTGLNINNPDSP